MSKYSEKDCEKMFLHVKIKVAFYLIKNEVTKQSKKF